MIPASAVALTASCWPTALVLGSVLETDPCGNGLRQ